MGLIHVTNLWPSRRQAEVSGHRDDSGCPKPQVQLGSALETSGHIGRL
jgi:hypothetical protein